MRRVSFIFLGLCLVLNSCGGGGGDSESSIVGAFSEQSAFVPKSAFTFEDLENKEIERANPAHTIFGELHHPDSELSEKSVRSIPYSFEVGSSKEVCLTLQEGENHRAFVVDSTGNSIAELHSENSCETVNFKAGDYELRIEHGGSGAPEEPTVVFAAAKYTQTSSETRFGKFLESNLSPSLTREQSLERNASECVFADTVHLRLRGHKTHFASNRLLRVAAFNELNRSDKLGFILSESPDDRTSPIGFQSFSSSAVRIYDCRGGRIKMSTKFLGSEEKFLVSQCGYLHFSASDIDSATALKYNWNRDDKSFSLYNPETNRSIKPVNRGRGRMMRRSGKFGSDLEPGSGIERVGTCDDYPGGFEQGSSAKRGPLAGDIYTLAEFDFNSTGEKLTNSEQYRNHFVFSRNLRPRSFFFENFRPGDFSSFDEPLGSSGDLQISEQNFIEISTGRCIGCDLGGASLSNRHLRSLILDGSYLKGVKLKNVTTGTASFINARISDSVFENVSFSGSDFTNVTIEGSTFSKTVLSDPEVFADITFPSANISRSEFTGIDFTGGLFSNAQISNSTFEESNFNNTDFTDSSITGTTFSSSSRAANFNDSIFQAAQLSSSSFTGMDFRDADFSKAMVDGTSFENAPVGASSTEKINFSPAVFPMSVIDESTFRGVNMGKADFSGSNIKSSNFDAVTTQNADFSNSTIDSSTFTRFTAREIDFRNSTFVQAVKFPSANLYRARFERLNATSTDFSSAFVVGADFTESTLIEPVFDQAVGYSFSGDQTTFKGATISGGSFSSAQFMNSSFQNTRLQGPSFNRAILVAAKFNNATRSQDSTNKVLSFTRAVLLGVDFGNASLEGGEFQDALLAKSSGTVFIDAEQDGGDVIPMPFGFSRNIPPAATDSSTICPDSSSGPCRSDSQWFVGFEDKLPEGVSLSPPE